MNVIFGFGILYGALFAFVGASFFLVRLYRKAIQVAHSVHGVVIFNYFNRQILFSAQEVVNSWKKNPVRVIFSVYFWPVILWSLAGFVIENAIQFF